MAIITPMIATMQQTEDFEEGVRGGYEMYEELISEGGEIKTPTDVWALFESELSPRALETDKRAEQIFGTPMSSFPTRVGFLVGYLTRAFTESQEENMPFLNNG